MKTENWKTVRLGDILLIQKKSKIKASDGIENGIYPFFTCSNDIVRTYNSAQYKGPALIFGTGGKASVHFCDTEFSTSTDCLTYYPVSSEINLDLVNQYIQSNIYLLENGFKGAGLKHVSRDYIANIEINLPDIKTQNCIVQKLNKAKNIISNSKKLLTKYDTLIKSRFIEMFGEIDISPQRNDWTELKDITTIYTGTTPSTTDEENWNGDILWITPAEMTSESFYIYNTERKITEKGQKSKSLSLMPANTVLLSTRAPIGKVGIAGSPMTCNQGFKNFYCKEDVLNPVYLYFLFKSNTEYLNSKGTGTTFKELSKSAAEKIKVPIPDFELQERFATFVQQIDKSKFEYNIEEIAA